MKGKKPESSTKSTDLNQTVSTAEHLTIYEIQTHSCSKLSTLTGPVLSLHVSLNLITHTHTHTKKQKEKIRNSITKMQERVSHGSETRLWRDLTTDLLHVYTDLTVTTSLQSDFLLNLISLSKLVSCVHIDVLNPWIMHRPQ